ncbi:hypothetical protein MTP04_35900 [Lysinibacillus sp. PLM2]|nr:hypothetical protein MTP04_35900 [Lysinibacillus sp. PLM2]
MSGKKAAITVVGIVLLVCFAILIAFQYFFSIYEPKNVNEEESSREQFIDEKITTMNL